MLYILTGGSGAGKSTWINRLITLARKNDVIVDGTVSPAVFEGEADAIEKIGIDSVLLPEDRRIRLATRRDLATTNESPDLVIRNHTPENHPLQNTLLKPRLKAGNGWAFSPEAVEEVNTHLTSLRKMEICYGNRLLVIDELGPLELLQGSGFIEGLALIDDAIYRHTIVVIRPILVEAAKERWPLSQSIRPDIDEKTFFTSLRY